MGCTWEFVRIIGSSIWKKKLVLRTPATKQTFGCWAMNLDFWSWTMPAKNPILGRELRKQLEFASMFWLYMLIKGYQHFRASLVKTSD